MLIDKYMAVWDKHEVHRRTVERSLEECFDVVSKVGWKYSFTSKLYKCGLSLLNLFKIKNKIEVKDLSLDSFIEAGFFVLENNGYDEIVIGSYRKINGQPAKASVPKSAEEFNAFDRKGCYKLAWNIKVESSNEQLTEIYTETRIVSMDAMTKKLFAIYWFMIILGSSMIRKDLLRAFEKQIMSGELKTE